MALLLSRMSITAEAAFNYFRIWGVLHSIDQIEHHCDQAVELGQLFQQLEQNEIYKARKLRGRGLWCFRSFVLSGVLPVVMIASDRIAGDL